MSTNTSAEFLPIGFGIQMRTKKYHLQVNKFTIGHAQPTS